MIPHFPMDIETQKNKRSDNPIAIWCITPNGKILGQKIRAALDGSTLFVSARLKEEEPPAIPIDPFERLSEKIQLEFNRFSGHVFIFSTGIAVRMIAPLLNSKLVDPAVVVTDDKGTHVISLISGHLGGANTLARNIAAIVCGTPVITTATDTHQLPAIDMIAQKQHLFIETPWNIKHINMAFLMGEPIRLCDPFGFIKNEFSKTLWTEKEFKGHSTKTICCSYKTKQVSRETLILRPPVLSIGIGCNRGTSCNALTDFLWWVLKKEHLSVNSIFSFATSDIKKDEQGLLDLSKKMTIQITFYDKEELNSVKTIVTPSEMVEKHLGVKSVCEAAAILAAGNGRLIVPKQKNKDVTLAVAIKK